MSELGEDRKVDGDLRVLFLASRYPYPAWRGDQVRVLHLARALSRRAELRLVCFGSDHSPAVDGVDDVVAVKLSAGGRLAANLRDPSPRLPVQVRLFLDRAMARRVADELDRWQPHVVHATLARMAPYLPQPGGVHRHLDLIDCLHLNMLRRAESSGPVGRAVFSLEARLMARYEREAAAAADSSSVVSDIDREAAGLSTGSVVPNGVDLAQFPYDDPVDRPPVMIFFGNLGYFPNVGPATFVATEVLPLVRRALPEASLRLAGARPAAAVRRAARADGAELIDSPAELAPELRRAAVAVLPMFSGTGIKNKVLEAFASGLPVVANRLGIEGVEGARPGTHFLLAEGADAIAAAAVSLLTEADERSRLAAAGRELIEGRYTWDRQAEAMLALYRSGARP